MPNTAPWTTGDLELRQDDEGTLYLEKASEKSDTDMVFTNDAKGLQALWATIAAGGVSMLNKSLVIYGEDTVENGDFPLSIEAAVRSENKKSGKEYGYAYTPDQIKAAKAKSLNMRYSFIMRCPQLWVFTTDFKLGFASNRPTKERTKVSIKRVDLVKPQTAKLKRHGD